MASRLERAAPLTGIAFVVLAIAALFLANGNAEFLGAREDLAAHYAENRNAVFVGSWLGFLASAALVWFSGSVWQRLRAAEGQGGRVSVIAFGGGVASAAIIALTFVLHAAAAARGGEPGGVTPDAAATLYDVAGFAWGGAAPVVFAALVAAVGLVGLRHAAFPAWWGWLSLVLALALVIGPISWIAFIVAHAWVLVLSGWMFATPAGEGTQA